jgi:lipopolysaccharide export system permease protein
VQLKFWQKTKPKKPSFLGRLFDLPIIDQYILKRYLATFSVMILLFIPIGITIDVSEKINKMLENKVPFAEIANYYFFFTIYFANILFPIFLFLSIIWFTSKLANNTEIIAILSSGISFNRFLRPYIIGATIVSIGALILGIFLAPKANEVFNNFRYTYLIGNGKNEMRDTENIFKQVATNEFIFVNSYSASNEMAFYFSLEKFQDQKMLFKITADRIQYNKKKKNYTLFNYCKRKIGVNNDILEKSEKKDTIFNFDIEDLAPTIYVAETLPLGELNAFIDKEQKRGSSNISAYLVVLYKKYSIPVSAFILTIIAVSVSSMKRRGGMGINLAIGIGLAFSFIFIDKIFGVLASKASINPMLAVWIPNIAFGVLAIFTLRNAKR